MTDHTGIRFSDLSRSKRFDEAVLASYNVEAVRHASRG